MRRIILVMTLLVGISLTLVGLNAFKRSQEPAVPQSGPTVVERNANTLKRVQTEQEFDALLRKEQAVLFFFVLWGPDRYAEEKAAAWAAKRKPPLEVQRVDPDEQPFVMKWLVKQNREDLAYVGAGCMAWLNSGKIVASVNHPGNLEELDAMTEKAFRGHQ